MNVTALTIDRWVGPIDLDLSTTSPRAILSLAMPGEQHPLRVTITATRINGWASQDLAVRRFAGAEVIDFTANHRIANPSSPIETNDITITDLQGADELVIEPLASVAGLVRIFATITAADPARRIEGD